jgi:hypothetical protein
MQSLLFQLVAYPNSFRQSGHIKRNFTNISFYFPVSNRTIGDVLKKASEELVKAGLQQS